MISLTPVQTVAPTAELITVAEAKEHLAIIHDDSDALVQRLIYTAVGQLDGWAGLLGRCLLTQTWTQDFDGFPAGRSLPLPMPGVQSATIAYYDEDSVSQTLAASNWYLANGHGGATILLDEDSTWPATAARPDAVTVTLVMGYGSGVDVPEPIKSAALLLIEGHHDGVHLSGSNGPNSDKISQAVSHLIAPFRRVGI